MATHTVLTLLALALLSVAAPAAYGQQCSPSILNGKRYDLSLLAAALGNNTVVQTKDSMGQVYTYKVCGDLATMCRTRQDDSPGVCMRDNNYGLRDCGSTNTQSWGSHPKNLDGFTLGFYNGDDDRRTFIVFTCDPRAGVGRLEFVSESPVLTYNFQWTSKYVCPLNGEYTCCLYAGRSGWGSDMRTECLAESLPCDEVLEQRKVVYNWTIDGSCDQCALCGKP